MRELTVLTVASDRTSPRHIATSAATELEQYARKGKSPYWNVIPATEPASKSKNATLTDSQPVEDQPEIVVAHKLSTTPGQRLVENALETTMSNAGEKMETIEKVLLAMNGQDSVSEALSDDDFLQATQSIGSRFGDVYRLFDLTNEQHGYPIRSWNTVENIQTTYENHSRVLYAVKLKART